MYLAAAAAFGINVMSLKSSPPNLARIALGPVFPPVMPSITTIGNRLRPSPGGTMGPTCGRRIARALRGPVILTSGATVPVTGWVPGAVKFNTALLLSRGDLLVVLDGTPPQIFVS
jgi:hypothetical protein